MSIAKVENDAHGELNEHGHPKREERIVPRWPYFKVKECGFREGLAFESRQISQRHGTHDIDLWREPDIMNENDDGQQKYKQRSDSQEPAMRRVDEHIFFTQVQVATDSELSQNPVGEFDRPAHVADPPTKSSSPKKYREQNADHHNRCRIDSAFGQRRHAHHRGLTPNLDVEHMP